ncbi:hypothetical protein SAMN05443634_105213 [Chishuiella changwenlii]|uniref:Uncharacterized protein n=1 Tax=Chishuiella changwenlii TaxID=1434701 RepID=A0A1M6XDU6_9FLAO|nr:hypothetical protein [Chishuiella changwenlii]GGF00512.1 hypothetical protein GCM10010984_17650 [Chishuiella changwenlii]SHL04126.1 hypothetical protein SAMN05443634_105213 [Chishuiella changwenlii]
MKKILFINVMFLSVYTFSQVGINTPMPQGILHVDAKNNNSTTGSPTLEQQSDDFVVSANGNIGIGTTNPDTSAILELNVNQLADGNKKGFLAPKLSLKSRVDISTIPNPAVGLLIYNLGIEPTFTYKGYVFWNETEWRAIDGSSLAEGTIGSITCNSVTLIPSNYTTGVPYNGTMNVPYTGGNGGTYQAQTLGPINGLTASLSAGNFENGAGALSYNISGVPTVSTPNTTTFNISLGGQTCSAVIGGGDVISPGDLVYYRTIIPASVGGGGNNATTSSNWMNFYASDLPVIGGKLRLDGYFSAPVTGSGTISFNPRLVNVSDSPVRFFFSAMTTVDNFNTANIVLSANGGWVNLDNGIYNGYGENNTTSNPSAAVTSVGQANTEVVTVDLSLDDKWYRIYYYPIIDNNNTTSIADDQRKIFLSIQRLY